MANAAVIEYENENMAGRMLAQGTSAGYTRTFCKSASATVPSAIGSVSGRKYQSSSEDWSADAVGNSGFACLHFTIDVPQYYMYGYQARGTGDVGDTFTSTANGDLDGDGVLSTFQLVGAINSSFVVNIASHILESNPDE
jgi:hypothetical protein